MKDRFFVEVKAPACVDTTLDGFEDALPDWDVEAAVLASKAATDGHLVGCASCASNEIPREPMTAPWSFFRLAAEGRHYGYALCRKCWGPNGESNAAKRFEALQ